MPGLTTILSILGGGSLIAALVIFPGLAARLVGLLRALVGLIADYPWQVLCAVLAAATAWLWFANGAKQNEIAALTAWQDDVVTAARDAAHRPKLGKRYVAEQVRNLGITIDRVRIAQGQAYQIAVEAKRRREQDDERKRKEHDDALPARIDEERRRALSWIDGHRLHGQRGRKASIDRGTNGAADLPDPAFGSQEPDRSDSGSDDVAVPAGFVEACAVVTARLKDAAAWASETLTPVPGVSIDRKGN